jgi:hypothetical protein
MRSVGHLVSEALDPVLVPAGFAAGQYGDEGVEPRAGRQVIFCAAHDKLSDRYPRLPQANAQEREVGACIDLVIEVDRDDRISFVDLEGPSLEETLRDVGQVADAQAVAAVVGGALADGLPVIEAALRRMLVDAS